MFSLATYLDDKRRIINKILNQLMDQNAQQGRLFDAMYYSLMAGGKRIRPILLLAAAEAIGKKKNDDLLHAACALEMIHTYSLIHDDLPSMDNDDLRRGKPTCHVQFDEATAILAGDALLTFAFFILSSENDRKHDIDMMKRLQVIHIISEASGHIGMVGGQMLDIINEGDSIDLEKLKVMHALKTGELIRASVVSGAVLGGGNDSQISALTQYGRNIGLAFQVMDDILDVEGDPSLMGKSTGSDAAHHKNTYPSLMGLHASKQFAAQLIKDALHALRDFDDNAEPLRKIANYIITRHK